jgi:hypothetical protein
MADQIIDIYLMKNNKVLLDIFQLPAASKTQTENIRIPTYLRCKHRYLKNIDCSSFVMCPLLAPHLPRHFWLLFLLLRPLTVLMNQTRQVSSLYYLDVCGCECGSNALCIPGRWILFIPSCFLTLAFFLRLVNDISMDLGLYSKHFIFLVPYQWTQ